MNHSYEFFLFSIMYYEKMKYDIDEINAPDQYHNQVIPLFEEWEERESLLRSNANSTFDSIELFIDYNV